MSENTNNQGTNKWLCVLAYFGILFFIPLVVDSSNEVYKFHANQGLNLFLFGLIVNVAARFIPYIGFIISMVGGIASLVFAIMGILNAINEETKELPLIGQFRLIK